MRTISYQNQLAALTIQRIYRGWHIRFTLWSYGGIMMISKVVMIQRVWRGYHGRLIAADKYRIKLNAAAHILQSMFYRWKYRTTREKRMWEALNRAITKFQSCFRRRMAIKIYRVMIMLKKIKMASKIQRSFRVYRSFHRTSNFKLRKKFMITHLTTFFNLFGDKKNQRLKSNINERRLSNETLFDSAICNLVGAEKFEMSMEAATILTFQSNGKQSVESTIDNEIWNSHFALFASLMATWTRYGKASTVKVDFLEEALGLLVYKNHCYARQLQRASVDFLSSVKRSKEDIKSDFLVSNEGEKKFNTNTIKSLYYQNELLPILGAHPNFAHIKKFHFKQINHHWELFHPEKEKLLMAEDDKDNMESQIDWKANIISPIMTRWTRIPSWMDVHPKYDADPPEVLITFQQTKKLRSKLSKKQFSMVDLIHSLYYYESSEDFITSYFTVAREMHSTISLFDSTILLFNCILYFIASKFTGSVLPSIFDIDKESPNVFDETLLSIKQNHRKALSRCKKLLNRASALVSGTGDSSSYGKESEVKLRIEVFENIFCGAHQVIVMKVDCEIPYRQSKLLPQKPSNLLKSSPKTSHLKKQGSYSSLNKSKSQSFRGEEPLKLQDIKLRVDFIKVIQCGDTIMVTGSVKVQHLKYIVLQTKSPVDDGQKTSSTSHLKNESETDMMVTIRPMILFKTELNILYEKLSQQEQLVSSLDPIDGHRMNSSFNEEAGRQEKIAKYIMEEMHLISCTERYNHTYPSSEVPKEFQTTITMSSSSTKDKKSPMFKAESPSSTTVKSSDFIEFPSNILSFPSIRFVLPVVEYSRRLQSEHRSVIYATLLLQKCYRGYRGRARYRRLKAKFKEKLIQQIHRDAILNNIREVRKMRDAVATLIQCRVRGWSWRKELKKMIEASIVIQCIFRIFQAKNIVNRERLRKLMGPEVKLMIRKNVKIKGKALDRPDTVDDAEEEVAIKRKKKMSDDFYFNLSIYRCGENYRMIGIDSIRNTEYNGVVYGREVRELLRHYNNKLDGIDDSVSGKEKKRGGPLKSLPPPPIALSLTQKQARIHPWQYERVCNLMIQNLGLIHRIAPVTAQLGSNNKDGNLSLVVSKEASSKTALDLMYHGGIQSSGSKYKSPYYYQSEMATLIKSTAELDLIESKQSLKTVKSKASINSNKRLLSPIKQSQSSAYPRSITSLASTSTQSNKFNTNQILSKSQNPLINEVEPVPNRSTYFTGKGGSNMDLLSNRQKHARVIENNDLLPLSGVRVPSFANLSKSWDGGFFIDGKESILISIASYRDFQCVETIANAYQRADAPERIFVVAVDQIVNEDVGCDNIIDLCIQKNDLELVVCRYIHQISIFPFNATLSTGPVTARHIADRMYRGEYFVMQIDAHCQFIKHWDTKIIQQWKATKNEMAILTAYLSDVKDSIDENGDSKRKTRPIMCVSDFEDNYFMRHGRQPEELPTISDMPMLEPFWAAGFSFSRGHFKVRVPYDPYLPMVFQGEEISMGIRAFTYGYDFYAPIYSVVFHEYADSSKRRQSIHLFNENIVKHAGEEEKSLRRAMSIIGMANNFNESTWNQRESNRYGTGSVRTPQQFYKYFVIDVVRKTNVQLCWFVKSGKMHNLFQPCLHFNGLGIDYNCSVLRNFNTKKYLHQDCQELLLQAMKLRRPDELLNAVRYADDIAFRNFNLTLILKAKNILAQIL